MSDETLDETTGEDPKEYVAETTGYLQAGGESSDGRLEKEKQLREMIINEDGFVQGDGLDDLEKYIFSVQNTRLKHETVQRGVESIKSIIKENAERLGFRLKTDDIKENNVCHEHDNPIYDEELPEPHYKKTIVPEDAPVMIFRKNRGGSVRSYPGYFYDPDQNKYKVPNVDLRIMANVMKAFEFNWHSGDNNKAQKGFNRVTSAAEETARRLGYRPVLDQEYEDNRPIMRQR